MRRGIERGQRHGEIAPEKDPFFSVRFMPTMMQGMRGIGNATPEWARLEDVIDVALGALGQSISNPRPSARPPPIKEA